MKKSKIRIFTAKSFAFEENTYIVHLAGSSQCLIFDPGIDTDDLFGKLEQGNLIPVATLITHGHYDHIGGIPAIREKWPSCEILTSEIEAEKLVDPDKNLSSLFQYPCVVAAANRFLKDGEEIELAGIRIKTMHIPGHAAGHLVYMLPDTDPLEILVGDTIFSGSIGRGDFPDGDSALLVRTLKDKILTLPEDTILYPGHGEPTTVGRERRTNPFLK